MKKILFVHQGESISYLIDRIENTKEQDLDINIDANLDLFSDLTNLKLLKREINFLEKRVTIISNNRDILSFIENAGFNVKDERVSDETSEIKEISENSEQNQDDDNSISFLENSKEEALDKFNNLKQDSEGSVENLYNVEDSEKEEKLDSFFEKSIKEKSENDIDSSIFKKRSDFKNIAKDKKFNINPQKIFLNNKKLTYISALLLVVLLFTGIYIFRSKATLNVAIKKETLDFTFPVTADANLSKIDLNGSRVPGQIIKLENEFSGEYKATGASEGATKASGKLTIYNEFGGESQALVANTRFQTEDGKIFRIQKRVIVPGAKMKGGKVESPGILEVEVLADEPGSEYNIGPANFKIPGFKGTEKYDGFYAKSSKAMEGGSFGEKRAISESNLKKAKEDLVKKLQKERFNFIKSNIPNNLVFLNTGIEEKYGDLESPKEGSAADTFKAKLKVSYNIIAFDQKDINTLTEESLALRLKEERKTYPETKTISYEDGVLNLDKSSFAFSVRASEVVGGKLNSEELKRELAGKGEIEIRKILTANDAIETAEITLWPFWASKAPSNPEMIKLIIKE